MARKTNKKNSKKSQGPKPIVVFWLVFIVVIVSVFMVNAQTIQKNFGLFKTRLTTSPGTGDGALDIPFLTEETQEAPIAQRPTGSGSRSPQPAPTSTTVPPPDSPSTPSPVTTTTPPATAPTTVTSTPSTTPSASTTQQQRPPAAPTPPAASASRDRNVYYTQIDKDGQILQSRTNRRIPVTESPMVDTLNVLLAGPSADELGRGIVNLIPANTRIISATVRGNTAYINFSEDFLFNTFGVEGYVAQLRQIVWTVTEFPNVLDVQFLIEGRRLDYLGEGIWIGSPIGRQSF